MVTPISNGQNALVGAANQEQSQRQQIERVLRQAAPADATTHKITSAEELVERWIGQGLAHLESVSPSADAACEQGSSVESTGAQGTPSGGTEGRQSGTIKL